jgi:hypothetical protein
MFLFYIILSKELNNIMEQPNLFGFILSVIERRLATYFGDDKNLHLDEKELTYITEKKEVYSEGMLPSYSSDSFEKCKDFNIDTIDFNQTKSVQKFGKVTPIMEDIETPKVEQTYKTPLGSLEANDEYCDMV